jgi:hypothetical protein
MLYCNLQGGLCNMLFQISATYAFAKEINTEPAFPNLINHLNYLNNENIHNPKLNYAEEYLQFFKNCNILKPCGAVPLQTYPFHYDPSIPQDNSCIMGFFQSEKYFVKYKNDILNYFNISENIKNNIENLLTNLPKEFNVIHVRLGDFLKNPTYHYNLPLSYFFHSIEKLNSNLPYLIFSDDIEICKENFIGNNYIFIENNKDYIDLLLMSYGNNYILSNSTFGWWGAWMNRNHKRVLVPSKWFGPNLNHLNTNDLIPETWEIQNI